MVVVWVVLFVLFAAYSAAATVDLYPSVASRVAAAGTINGSQALVAMYGRVYDPSSLGALAMIKTGGLGAVFVAMFAVVLAYALNPKNKAQFDEAARLPLEKD